MLELLQPAAVSFQQQYHPPRSPNSLLDPRRASINAIDMQNKLDDFLNVRHLSEVHEMVKAALLDHRDMVGSSSDSHIMYYVSGYVARKRLKKTKCSKCSKILFPAKDSDLPEEYCLISHMNKGGLLCPSQPLKRFGCCLEDTFTHCFSFNELSLTASWTSLPACPYTN